MRRWTVAVLLLLACLATTFASVAAESHHVVLAPKEWSAFVKANKFFAFYIGEYKSSEECLLRVSRSRDKLDGHNVGDTLWFSFVDSSFAGKTFRNQYDELKGVFQHQPGVNRRIRAYKSLSKDLGNQGDVFFFVVSSEQFNPNENHENTIYLDQAVFWVYERESTAVSDPIRSMLDDVVKKRPPPAAP